MYIGAEPNIGNYSMLDAITTSATATYNLTKGGVAFTPENPLGVICSLNGVIQKAGSSFNIVNNTIVFSQALTSNDSIDFILVMGERIDLNVPADASVTNAKTNFVSSSSSAGLQIKGDGTTAGTLELMCEQGSHGIKIKSAPHSANASYTLTLPNNDGNADQFLKTDGSGVLSFADAGGGGMTFITSVTPSGSASNVGIQSCFSSTYTNYKIIYSGVGIATNNSDMVFTFYSGTNTEHTSGYYWSIGTSNRDGSSINEHANNDSYARYLNNSSNDDYTQNGEILVLNPNVNGSKTSTVSSFIDRFQGDAIAYPQHGGMWLNSGSVFTGINFKTTSGSNFRANGKITVYGLHDS